MSIIWEDKPMTKAEFAAMCGEMLVAPGVAMENESVRQALREKRPAAEVREILATEF